MVRRQCRDARPAAGMGAAGPGGGHAHVICPAGLHRRHPGVRVDGGCRSSFAASRVPCLRPAGRGLQCSGCAVGRQPRDAAGPALCHRVLPGGHLPGRHEDRGELVSARPGRGARLARRCAGAGHGDAAPAARARRSVAVAGGDGDGVPLRGCRWDGHCRLRTRRAAPAARSRAAMARTGRAVDGSPRAGVGLRLLRAHVGAVHAVGAGAGHRRHAAGGRLDISRLVRGDRPRPRRRAWPADCWCAASEAPGSPARSLPRAAPAACLRR